MEETTMDSLFTREQPVLPKRGVRPILWHDMIIDWDSAALLALAGKCDLMPWGYDGHPDTTQGHYQTQTIKRFHEHGFSRCATSTISFSNR